MPFKTIVAILQNERADARVLDCAIPLAQRWDSHLVGVHAEALPVPYTSATGFPDTEFLQVSAELNKERAERLRSHFESRVGNTGLSHEWRSLQTFSADSALSSLASVRAADLIIASQNEENSDSDADIGSLVYDAGRPVLVVPHSGPVVTNFKRIVVAWNGSREAARATFDALPFILEAEHTEILIIDAPEAEGDREADAGTDIAASLSRHGAEVSVSVASSKGATIEDVIQQRLTDTAADMLILGAYSHSWLRRLIFGGVTKSVLRAGAVAAFLSR